MPVERLSISVPPELEAQIRAAAEEAGLSVSTWLARAAEHAAKLQAGRRAIQEYEAEVGPLPEESRRKARQFLREVGILPAEDMKAAG